jgi:hypothetical protein
MALSLYNKTVNLTADPKLRATDQYRRVESVIDQMFNTGVLQHAAGNCIALSELLQHLLMENSVNCKLIECKIMITERRQGQLVDFKYVGWDGGRYNRLPDAVDTHMMVVTEGDQPLLIDLSIPHVLPPPRVLICEPVNSLDPDVIAEYQWGDLKFRYDVKKNPRLLGLHQTSLLERISKEREQARTVRWLKVILGVVAVATMFNLFLNTTAMILRIDFMQQLEQVIEERPPAEPTVK